MSTPAVYTVVGVKDSYYGAGLVISGVGVITMTDVILKTDIDAMGTPGSPKPTIYTDFNLGSYYWEIARSATPEEEQTYIDIVGTP